MGVIVDPLFPTTPNARWRYKYAAHLSADTLEELVAFATRLGLKERWIQVSANGIVHFDLTKGMREKAIRLGAESVDVREFLYRAVRKEGEG